MRFEYVRGPSRSWRLGSYRLTWRDPWPKPQFGLTRDCLGVAGFRTPVSAWWALRRFRREVNSR